ncbi:MAG TPA: hypothetical protein VI548_06430 [Chitinophagaceae bacterium]|nr:hypothetical protein [Chitinophagaceae bacterium]
MHITEKLLNGTIRIEAVNKNVTGTGFFFTFYADKEKQKTIPVIITNKYVINGLDQIRLFFRKVKNNEPGYRKPFIVTIPNDTNTVIQHPDKDIDLVAIPAA